LGHLGAPSSEKVRKVRFGAFGPKKSSATISKKPPRNHLSKSDEIFKISKNKKVAKSHFCVFAYVYGVFARSGRSKSQKCEKLHFLHFGAPKSSKSHFCIRVRRFCPFWEPQIHFWRFWSEKSCPDRHWAPKGAEG